MTLPIPELETRIILNFPLSLLPQASNQSNKSHGFVVSEWSQLSPAEIWHEAVKTSIPSPHSHPVYTWESLFLSFRGFFGWRREKDQPAQLRRDSKVVWKWKAVWYLFPNQFKEIGLTLYREWDAGRNQKAFLMRIIVKLSIVSSPITSSLDTCIHLLTGFSVSRDTLQLTLHRATRVVFPKH